MSDDAKIDAWLAGELSDEEASAVERSMAAGAPTESAGAEFLGLEPEPLTQEVDALIEQVRDSGKLVPPDAEEWRDILTPSDDPDLLGTLGTEPCYEITSVIAVAGMSIVFKGRDPKLNRTVAIKALTPELAANRTTHQRFLREARVAAGLDHENILPIFSVHDDASVPFFSMKFIGGSTLQELIDADGPLPFECQRSIARQISAALVAAHAAGVIHRDIKPANILLDESGQRAWLCDFGIARSTEDPSLTYAGNLAGTPHYMSPEQAAGGELDGRSDLFSLGAVLYHCATGEHAFPGVTTTAVLQQVQNVSAKLTFSGKPKLPKWYESLLTNLLAKKPDNRPADAAAVVRAIAEERAPSRKRLAIPAIAVVCLALLSIGLLPGVKNLFIPSPAERPEEATTAVTEITIEATGERFDTLAEAIETATDGATILLSGRIAPTEEIVVREKSIHLVAAPGARPTIVGTIPDDHAIFFWAGGSIKGIRFLREDADWKTMPVLGMRPKGDPFVIEDCVFESVPAEAGAASPFIITDGSAAELRRCVFINPGGANLGIYFRDQVGVPLTVKLEDCLFTGGYSIELKSKIRNTDLDLSVKRCTFVTNQLLSLSRRSRSPIYTTAVSFTDCIIDCQAAMLSFTDVSKDSLKRHLSWSGKNNIYRQGTPVLETPLSALGIPQPAPLSRFEDLAPAILNFREVSPTYGTPFDRTRLKTPISQASLLEVLDPNLESPAVQSLKKLGASSL